jgi:hypothetical protein
VADAMTAMDAWAFEELAGALDPLPPPSALRARLMGAVDGPAKYLPFCGPLATQFDLPHERMKALLLQIDEPGRWVPGLDPLQGFLHFRPGPRFDGLHGGFARMRRGMQFPLHRHRDREVTYVLEGHVADDAGRWRGPGGAFDMPVGSDHTLTVSGDGDCLVAILHGGIEMLGT